VSHPKPYPRCVFCGDRANSREHAIPAWISKRLGIKEFLPAEPAIRRGSLAFTRHQPISFASHRARIFCKPCNTHFKDLEDAVIPLLVPMAKGRSVSLGPDSQALLALWASKTAIALLAAADPAFVQFVPVDHRRSIREHGRPSDETWVAYFPWRGSPVMSIGNGTAGRHNVNPASRHEMYAAGLAFAKIGFYAMGFIQAPGSKLIIDGAPPPLIQFLPGKHPMIRWPPNAAPLTSVRNLITSGFTPLR
jgi:hypothetical protein